MPPRELLVYLFWSLVACSTQADSPPPWPTALHMTGNINGSTKLFGIDVTPGGGVIDFWSLCDPAQPGLAKLKIEGSAQK